MNALFRAALIVCCLLLAGAAGERARAEKNDAWVEVRSPNFVVVSNAGEKQARKTAVQFEQIRGVFREHLKVAGERPTPVITIFAVKDEDSLRELLPEYWAKGHSRPAGVFFYRLGQFEAAVELDARGANPYETLYHEYYHSLTVPYFTNLPVWLAEGLADFFGNTDVRGGEARIGQADPSWINTLRQNSFIPLDVLFKVDRSSPYYNEQNQTSIFYAESWALTHYLMVGDRMSHMPMFTAYLKALQEGATPEEAAAQGFGDLGALQQNVEKYIQSAAFFEMRTRAPEKVSEAELAARELSDAEVLAYKGGFAALRAHLDEARPMLEEAVRLDPKLALAHQNLGLLELFDGHRSVALTAFSQASALDPKKALTRYLRADLSFNEGVGLNDPQVEADLRQAIAADPNFAPSYGLLAVYLAARDEKLPEALAMAKKGVSLEPGNAIFELALVQVLTQMRRFDEAKVAARQARANAIDAGERVGAEQYLAYLENAKNDSDGNVPHGGPAVNLLQPIDPADQVSSMYQEQGAHVTAEGQIADVTCNGNEMALGMVAGGKQFVLHARDYSRLTWDDDRSGFDKHELPACAQLKGLVVSISFVVVESKQYDGEMESVEIEK